MTEYQENMLFDTMCAKYLQKEDMSEIFIFGENMRSFFDGKPQVKSMDDIVEEAKKTAGFI